MSTSLKVYVPYLATLIIESVCLTLGTSVYMSWSSLLFYLLFFYSIVERVVLTYLKFFNVCKNNVLLAKQLTSYS
jgi:hypothetical protein